MVTLDLLFPAGLFQSATAFSVALSLHAYYVLTQPFHSTALMVSICWSVDVLSGRRSLFYNCYCTAIDTG